MTEWMLKNGPEAEMAVLSDLEAEWKSDLEAQAHHSANSMTILDASSAEPAAHETTKEDSAMAQDAATDLARAAQQLVDSVADNDSDKFKNSAFLALMRRIASQQLTVQGNDLVETSQPLDTETDSGSQDTSGTSSAIPLN
jgi:hypothetical protein